MHNECQKRLIVSHMISMSRLNGPRREKICHRGCSATCTKNSSNIAIYMELQYIVRLQYHQYAWMRRQADRGVGAGDPHPAWKITSSVGLYGNKQ